MSDGEWHLHQGRWERVWAFVNKFFGVPQQGQIIQKSLQ